jgi:carboxyl-terminal processing protease
LQKVGFAAAGSKRKTLLRRTASSRLRVVLCSQKKNDEVEKKGAGQSTNFMAGLEEWKDGVEQWKADVTTKVRTKIPPKLLELLELIWSKLASIFPTVRTALLGFTAGAIITLTAILVPVYSSVENLSQPVTLFETILADLDAGYVDPVDTNKLFETGISAMLRSLDPYTEFEGKEDAKQLSEGISGRYGGVGLVIAGATPKDLAKLPPSAASSSPGALPTSSKLLPQDAIEDSVDPTQKLLDGDMSSNSISTVADDDLEDYDEEDGGFSLQKILDERKAIQRARAKGVRVVSAFEGYAFDYGMRVGDKIVAVDDKPIGVKSSVDDVRNLLRGEPGTLVTISFEREGVPGVQEVTMPRTVVRLRDVKLATLVGKKEDGIGYVSVSGFASNTGEEVRQAILALERAAEDASNGAHSLQGLILDLRGNPGGLLTSAVDVASLLVPKGSDIVSAKGRGFPGVLYRSRVDPILDPSTKLAILVNRGTASAAEIVSGAVQDLDVGVIVGTDRTFGKGLVQNVEDLPFDTALKFTVAKYYTPSGRCIQGVNYKEGGGLSAADGKYTAQKIKDKDRQIFYTKEGRIVKDGGGIEADYKVAAPKASALEITLLRTDVLGEFAAQWSRKNELTTNFEVDEATYKEFQDFVNQRQKVGEIKLEGLYAGALTDLKQALKQSGYSASEREVNQLQSYIVREISRDFEKYKDDIKEDIANSILARYYPESMLLKRSLDTDRQVDAAVKLLSDRKQFDKQLALGRVDEKRFDRLDSMSLASSEIEDGKKDSAKFQVEW